MFAQYRKKQSNVLNYHPVSLLSVFSKIFESIIYSSLTSYVITLKSENQHGFVRNKFAIINLVEYRHNISKYIDHKSQVDVIYFSSACDTGVHNILIKQLKRY